jgi:MFS family permease
MKATTERAIDDLEMDQCHKETGGSGASPSASGYGELSRRVCKQRHSVFSKWQKRWIVFLASFAGWFSTLSSFIFFPTIPTLAQDLHISIGKINLTITSYLIFAAVAPSIVGNFADTLGRRPAYIATLTVYIVANIGLAAQSSFAALFILRMLQSASISGTTLQVGVNLYIN